jgi:hypothetical protein
MGRSGKDLRRTLAPITGLPSSDDSALVQAAVPPEQPAALSATVKTRSLQLRSGIPKGLPR